ncbi:MAG: 50S ribosome-binding GTPase, partial [Deltaproteobacteria bacterium]|nr:50S ribosome-binding GTPase [Deltaproteobacteria bacterium]
MPANLTPDYLAAEERFRRAATVREKIVALEEMLKLIPKHKGTDRLQGELKARLAKLRRTPEKKGVRAGFSWHIPSEGAGQVALVGLPNTGKSSLVAALTRAEPEVGAWAGTTREPTPGMMPWEDVAIQLIDLAPLDAEHTEPWVFDLARRADLVWLVVSGDDPLTGLEDALEILSGRSFRFHPAFGETPPEGPDGARSQPLLVVATGLDRTETADNVAALLDLLEVPWPVCTV